MGPPMTIHGWLRYSTFRRLLRPEVKSILEIGAGLGAVGARLAGEFRYVGLEPDPQSFAVARQRVESVLCVSEEDYSSSEPFDAVCAFEVLEHIEDDVAALHRWRRHLRTGGWLFASVPRGSFGASDERQGHFRRYTRSSLADKLAQAGLVEADVVSYAFPAGHVLLAWSDAVANQRPSADVRDERTAASARWMQPTWRSAALRQALAVPLDLLQRPFAGTELGTGLVIRARSS